MEPPRVAVLMAVHDGVPAALLRDAIESMLNQTYGTLDLHIMLDGVTRAGIKKLLMEHGARDSRVRLHPHRQQRGLAACLNDLISRVRADYAYFARMDADDVSLVDRLDRQVRFMEEHPEVDVLGGSIIDIDAHGRELRRVTYPVEHEDMLAFFQKRPTPIAHVTVMFRESYFAKAGLYPPVALEDGLYWMRGFLAGCCFHNLPDPLVQVRRTDEFLRRRSSVRRQWQELVIKCRINRSLQFGLLSYLYAVGIFAAQILPVPVKRVLYDRLR